MAHDCGTLLLTALVLFAQPSSGVQVQQGTQLQGKMNSKIGTHMQGKMNSKVGTHMQGKMKSKVGTHLQGKMNSEVNPVRRVVTMMQDMKYKIEDEGVEADKLWEEVYCECKTLHTTLQKAIDLGIDKQLWFEKEIEVKTAENQQLKIFTKKMRVDRENAIQVIAEEKTIRGKDKATFDKEYADTKMNLDALKKAVKQLEGGMGGSFLQTKAAGVVRDLSLSMEMSDEDRDKLASFLSVGAGQTYTPQSGEILGILKQMKDTTEKEYKQLRADEIEAERKHRKLVAAKEKQIGDLSDAIQRNGVRMAELGVQLVSHKMELKEVLQALKTNRKMLDASIRSCTTKKAQHEENTRTRAQELGAITQAIAILNNDESLELFKKAMVSPSSIQVESNDNAFSFLQVKQKEQALQKQALQKQALAALYSSGSKDIRLNFISLALKGKKLDFGKIIISVNKMMKNLEKEQRKDDEDKEDCETKIDREEDKLRKNNRTAEVDAMTLDELNQSLIAVGKKDDETAQEQEEMMTMLQKQGDLRREENTQFEKALMLDTKARETIAEAKNVLLQFYDPDAIKQAKLKKLQSEIQISEDMPSFVQVASQSSYKPAKAESSGVLAMLDTYLMDLDKEIKESTEAEKQAVADYDALKNEVKEKNAELDKLRATYAQEKADVENDMYQLQEKDYYTRGAISTGLNNLRDYHQDCDWLILNYEVRLEARRGEKESLKSAKAVLNGADFSFVQTERTETRELLRR